MKQLHIKMHFQDVAQLNIYIFFQFFEKIFQI